MQGIKVIAAADKLYSPVKGMILHLPTSLINKKTALPERKEFLSLLQSPTEISYPPLRDYVHFLLLCIKHGQHVAITYRMKRPPSSMWQYRYSR